MLSRALANRGTRAFLLHTRATVLRIRVDGRRSHIPRRGLGQQGTDTPIPVPVPVPDLSGDGDGARVPDLPGGGDAPPSPSPICPESGTLPRPRPRFAGDGDAPPSPIPIGVSEHLSVPWNFRANFRRGVTFGE